MALKSAIDGVQKIFSALVKHKRDYEATLRDMTEVEVMEETNKRLGEYKAMCLCGGTSMLWKDTYSLVKKLHGVNSVVAAMGGVFFFVAMFAIVIGLAAATFSRSAPYPVAIAGHGALWSVLFVIITCHLKMLEFLPIALVVISCVLFSLAFVIYWYFCG